MSELDRTIGERHLTEAAVAIAGSRHEEARRRLQSAREIFETLEEPDVVDEIERMLESIE